MDRGHIKEIPITEKDKWNSIVRGFGDYEVFYLNEYSMAFWLEDNKKSEPVLLVYENGTDRAVSVVFKRDVADDPAFEGKINHGEYTDLISPYGYGGFWGEVGDWNLLNACYEKYCMENGYICEFVRFDLFGRYSRVYGGTAECRMHNVVRNLEMPVEEIWMDFKGKVRRNVKRAFSYELKVTEDPEGQYLDDFLRVYYMTMERDSAEPFYFFSRRFFETLLGMKDNITFFHTWCGEKIISTEVVLHSGNNAYFFLGGSDMAYSQMRPNDLLKYEIIKWCHARGMKNYILGGGYGSDDGLFRYKECLAPHGVVEFYTGRKIFDQKKYDFLLDLRAVDKVECRNLAFFPQYRG